ncbi:ABC transporter substrate-binding protein [Nocardioides hungaricus]
MKTASRQRTVRCLGVLITAAALATVSACGSSGDKDVKPTSEGSSKVRALLPEEIKSKGVLVVATDPTYPPFSSTKDDGSFEGFDVDVANMLADKMGLRLDLKGPTFDSIIPGLVAGRYDLGIAALGDNEERRQTLDFVDYFSTGVQGVTLSENADKYATLESVCGTTVAMQGGSQQVEDLKTYVDPKCAAAGQPAPEQIIFKSQSQANLALQDGRADLTYLGVPSASLLVEGTDGMFALAGDTLRPVYGGIAMLKGSPLVKAVREAMIEAKADGTYEEALKRWKLDPAKVGVSDFLVNGNEL